MQQKVAIARAFLTSPVLLLLDEPTTGLDPRSKRDVQDFVLQLRDQHDATILLCSHDMDEAERLCDRIAVLDQGRGRRDRYGSGSEARRQPGARRASMSRWRTSSFISPAGTSREETNDEVRVA